MNRPILIILSSVAGLTMVGAALLYTPSGSGGKNQIVSAAQLKEHGGVNGRACWVAIDKKVYEISGFAQWQMGKHLPSNGKATCGNDLSKVILESPHGTSKLQLLKVVGTYQP
ncbi:MAG TPA: hypothetical protein VF272_00260 [Candidatus Saccharimonadia bacterium]